MGRYVSVARETTTNMAGGIQRCTNAAVCEKSELSEKSLGCSAARNVYLHSHFASA